MSVFAGLDRFSDWLEDRIVKIPGLRWFHYNRSGDVVSWLQHGLWALVAALVGWLIGWPFGLAPLGRIIGALVMLGFYLVREAEDAVLNYKVFGWAGAVRSRRVYADYQGGPHVGWLLDAIGDVAGPALVLLAAVLLW